MKDSALKFEQAVRDYLNGSRDWEGVHELAVEMEWLNEAGPAHLGRPMEELQMIFLADATDDPQFRADRAKRSPLCWKRSIANGKMPKIPGLMYSQTENVEARLQAAVRILVLRSQTPASIKNHLKAQRAGRFSISANACNRFESAGLCVAAAVLSNDIPRLLIFARELLLM